MIRTSSFRIVRSTPGHATYGVWVNGGKCGDLVVRQDEREGFESMMQQGGFAYVEAAPETISHTAPPAFPTRGSGG